MTGAFKCEQCDAPGHMDEEILRLVCSCGGAVRFLPAYERRIPDTITVPGVPALVEDLIVRFRSEDRVVTEEAVRGYHLLASATRPRVESELLQIVREENGDLAGLEFAVKEIESVRRKVRSRLSDHSCLRNGSAITDALRFTAIFASDEYSANAQTLLWNLQDKGQTILDEENSWELGDSYSGLHYILKTPEGTLYELQIHTPESFLLKNGTNHNIYEEFRSPLASAERKRELAAQMAAEWELIGIPGDALGFGGRDAEKHYDV